MKTMTRSLLALILCLCLFGTTVLATEVESNEQDTLSCQVQLTHVSLDPVNDALGYKAQILADEAVMSQITGFGFELWVDGGNVVTYTKTENIQDTLALRLKNILANGGGEMNINGRAFVTIGDQTIYSDTHVTTMKAVIESINSGIGGYNKTQIQAVQDLVKQYADAVAQWNVAQILNWQEKVSFVSGTYQIIAMAGDKYYALGSNASGGLAEAIDATGAEGQIVTDNAPEWNITVLDQYGTVSLTTAEGEHLWRDEGKANLYINDNDEQKDNWKLAVDAEGYYTLSNADTTDSRYLAYNGSGFKAYAAASDSRFIQLMLIPTMPTVDVAAGEYAVVAVAGDKYYAMGSTAEGGVVEAVEVTVEDGMVTDFDTNKWSVNLQDAYGTVTLTNAEGKYLMRADGSANLDIGSGETLWQLVADESGCYTLANTNTDVRFLSYNGAGFKAYKEATEERFIQIMLLPVKEKPVLTSGTYMLVSAMDQKAVGTTITSGVAAAHDLVYVNGEILAMDPWTITIDEEGLATFSNAAGQYLVSNAESSNLSLGDTATKWTVGVSEEGYFTFRNTNADKRYLSYQGTGFKVYTASNVQEKGYDIKFSAMEATGLQSGRYVLVAKAGDAYYAVGNSGSNVIAASDVLVDGQINTANATVWSVIVNADGTVSFRDAAGNYINGKSSSSNLNINTTATNWTVAIDADGYYTFSMGRYLAYMGTGFKAYAAASDSRFIQFMLVPAAQLESGKYAVVAQTADGYYAMQNTSAAAGVIDALPVTLEDGQIVTEGVDYWNINVFNAQGLAYLTTADGQKLMRADGGANLVLGNTTHKWVIAYDAEGGYYTLINTNTDSRFLSFNGTGFKAYAAATDARIIKLLLIPIA